MCKQSENKELALEWIKYMSQAHVQAKLAYTKAFKARAPNLEDRRALGPRNRTGSWATTPDPNNAGQMWVETLIDRSVGRDLPVRQEGEGLGSTSSTSSRRVSPQFSAHGHGLRGAVGRQSRNGAKRDAGTSGERRDARCRPDSVALRVAPRRPPAASRASTVFPDTLFGPLLADRTHGRDAGRDPGEKCGPDRRSPSCTERAARRRGGDRRPRSARA